MEQDVPGNTGNIPNRQLEPEYKNPMLDQLKTLSPQCVVLAILNMGRSGGVGQRR